MNIIAIDLILFNNGDTNLHNLNKITKILNIFNKFQRI